MSSRHEWLGLTGFLGLCFAVALVGSESTTPVLNDWYARLRKPSWTPPNWIFGPVWSILYTCMAVAAWLVWRKHQSVVIVVPLALFMVQLALNLGWSVMFFGMQNPGAACVEIVFLWGAIVATLLAFWRVTAIAGWLLVPYLGWVTFAVALNFAIWQLND
ncbi:MAG: tryptophan-rich sensory protein [Deltaproteobacteria bacterium]|nr:tryptophan-rich sensory protein [Deltaproteobacteria bacterium]